MATEAKTTNEATEKKKKKGIVVKEHIKFEGTLNSQITTTQDLANTVNVFFRNVLNDYEGCFTYIDRDGLLKLSLYFTDKGTSDDASGKIKVLANIAEKPTKPNDVIAKLKAIKSYANQNVNGRRMFTLTDDAKEVLTSLMDVAPNAKIDWNAASQELTSPISNFGSSYTVLVRVDAISINKILQTIYGSKDEEGNYVQYNTSIIRPVPVSPSSYVIQVMQLRAEELERLAMSTGMIASTGNVPMYKAY